MTADSALAASLSALENLPGVAAAVQSARTACTEIRWHNALRRRSAEARAEATVRSARNSAALEGARYPVDLVRDAARGASELPDDASGQLTRAAIRVYSEAAQVEKSLAAAPAQALARLHLAAAGGLLPADQVGRPRQDGELPGDGIGEPGTAPAGAALAARLAGIIDLLSAPPSAPALVVASLVHAEILTARPFVAGNGLVARAAAHAVIVGRGLDPMGVVVWEAAHLDAGPDYHRRLLAYTTGQADAVAAWLVHCADAVVKGAGEGRVVCDAVTMGRVVGTSGA
ncbi:Fic family protein [Kineosporia sp. J2-2]|uniref:Fic family protein n=1 Tax=Kineosporia corallincola TaxID=2835133 RepID=A0ABS5TA86_9ACTN|nr:Fic family protein [Kineosporia corallincola]MBT0767369.1 Fic family protein [Kineosporia corallincola]